MKKGLSCIISLCLMAAVVLGGIPILTHAASGSISISGVPSSVNIGDTISVTVTASSDVEALIQANVSCDGGALEYSGQGNGILILEPSAGATDSLTVTYKAVSPGTATISVTVTQAYDVTTQEGISISGSSATVTVNNAASSGGGSNPGGSTGGGSGTGGGSTGGDEPSGGGTQEPPKSADNSLKSLTISPGKLSPDFKGSTTRYTASVDEDVTSIAVDAQVSNSKATVESVTGNTDLKMGENTIKIVVKAENGTLATYTITVTRGGTAEEPDEEPEEPAEEPEENEVVLDGVSYEISETLPDTELPAEFMKSTADYGGKTVEAYIFPYKALTLLYLIPASQEDSGEGAENAQGGQFYFYNEAEEQFFPYINVTVGDTYVLVLPVSYAEDEAPAGWQEADVAIREFIVSGYRLSAGGEDTASDGNDTSVPKDMTDPENTADPEDTTEPDGTTVGAASKEANTRTMVSTGLGETDSDEDSTGTDGANADTVETNSTDTDRMGVDAAQEENRTAAEPAEFYLLYGVSRDGAAGWYQYDTADVSLQRYHAAEYVQDQEDVEALNKAYNELNNRYREEKSTSRLVIAVLIFLLVVAIFAIINILLFAVKGQGRGKGGKGDGDVDYIDLDDI